jgi:hypothetical protein
MLIVDMSHGIIASSKWQFVATLSVGTRAGGAIVHGAAGGKTVRESMPGEVPRSSCLVLTNRACVRLDVRIQMLPEIEY